MYVLIILLLIIRNFILSMIHFLQIDLLYYIRHTYIFFYLSGILSSIELARKFLHFFSSKISIF